MSIIIEHQPEQARLDDLNVYEWSIWEKEISDFSWIYDADETCYFLEGEVVVTPDGGEPVKMVRGDLVTFPRGMSCRWLISKAVRKHYRLY